MVFGIRMQFKEVKMMKKQIKLFSLVAFSSIVLGGCKYVYHYNIPPFPFSEEESGGGSGGEGGGGGTTADNGFEDTGVEDAGSYSIKIWCDERISTQVKTQVSAFKSHFGSKYTINLTVNEVSEGTAASSMTEDVQSGADIYVFAQDQLAKLKTAGALAAITKDLKTAVVKESETEAVNAASINGTMYAYPFTSDNGYYLYYDKAIISDEDATSIEKIVERCESSEKNINYPIFTNGFYSASYFMATGCESTWDMNKTNQFVAYHDNYNSDNGFKAAKAIRYLKAHSPVIGKGDDPTKLGRDKGLAACVSGIWNYPTALNAMEKAGRPQDLGCAEMPTFTIEGAKYHISSFSGYKLIGVKPQTDAKKVSVCKRIARYLSSYTCQLQRFKEVGWGPTNLTALADKDVKAHPGLAALRAQKPYSKPQVQCPSSWFSSVSTLANSIKADSTDQEIRDQLQVYEDNLEALLND